MPRTSFAAVAPQSGAQLGVVAAGDHDIVMTAGDVANGNEVPWTSNRLLLHAWNDSAGALTMTITAVADSTSGRLTTITTYSLAGDDHAYALFDRDGWQQTDGTLYIDSSGAAVKYVCLAIQ